MTSEEERAELLAKLHRDTRVPPAEKVTQVDKGFGPIDVLGHADTVDLILAHDPAWTWEPAPREFLELVGAESALIRDQEGWPRGLWIFLTIHGLSRPGFGTCAPKKPDAVKELIGDAIRNAAQRFGIAASLWSKADAKGWADPEEGDAEEAPETPTSEKKRPRAGKPSARESATSPGDAEDEPSELAGALEDSLRERLRERLNGLDGQDRGFLRNWWIERGGGTLDLAALSADEMEVVVHELDRRGW